MDPLVSVYAVLGLAMVGLPMSLLLLGRALWEDLKPSPYDRRCKRAEKRRRARLAARRQRRSY